MSIPLFEDLGTTCPDPQLFPKLLCRWQHYNLQRMLFRSAGENNMAESVQSSTNAEAASADDIAFVHEERIDFCTLGMLIIGGLNLKRSHFARHELK